MAGLISVNSPLQPARLKPTAPPESALGGLYDTGQSTPSGGLGYVGFEGNVGDEFGLVHGALQRWFF